MENRESYQKVLVFLVGIIIAFSGWWSKIVYDSLQVNSKRLTFIEATLLDRTEAVRRLDLLEHRVEVLEEDADDHEDDDKAH